MKEYSWAIQGFYTQDANEVGKELEKIDDLTPDNVINVAKDERNILHDIFEWDDSIAGHKYRQTQARSLISNIKVTIISDNNDEPVTTKAYVSLSRSNRYEPIEKIVKDVDKYAILLERAYKELNAIKNKYEEIKEIQDLLKDIPDVA